MNVRLLMAIGLVGGLVALSGCASTMDKDSRSLGMTTHSSDTDSAYMAQIDQEARQHGVAVVWVHPPQKKITDNKAVIGND